MRHFPFFVFTLIFSVRMLAAEFQSAELVGTWSGKAKDGTQVTYRFHKDGSVLWLVDEPNFKRQAPSGLRAKYTVRPKSPLWEIDIHDFEHAGFKNVSFHGILQPLEKNKVKIEGQPTNRGKRPQSFSDEAVIFSKTDP
jgi:hypothetical protein